jgi:hypothetical protein
MLDNSPETYSGIPHSIAQKYTLGFPTASLRNILWDSPQHRSEIYSGILHSIVQKYTLGFPTALLRNIL